MAFLSGLLNLLLVLLSIFLICLVLIQRGKGGGLAGAFGGVGGSSAFGTKAGDVFTRVTIVTAGIWFLFNMLLVVVNNQERASAFDIPGASKSAVATPSTKKAQTGTGTGTGTGAAAPATKSGGAELPAPPAAPTSSSTPKADGGLPAALEDEPKPATPPAEPSKTP